MVADFVKSGLAIGDLDLSNYDAVTGALIVAETVKGLGGASSTIEVTQNVRRRGGWAGEAFDAARHVAVSGRVKGEPLAVAETLDRLIAAVPLWETELQFTEFGRVRTMRVRREADVKVQHDDPGLASWSFQVVATDPRKFGVALTGTTPLPSSSGGLVVPFVVPFFIDATTATGQVTLTNPGNTGGPVRLRLDGPLSGPVITHVASGAQLVFSSSLSIGAGEWLDVDMEAHTVLANGQASRAPWITSRGWSQFEPGVNTWAFTASSYNPSAKLTVYATPAWQ